LDDFPAETPFPGYIRGANEADLRNAGDAEETIRDFYSQIAAAKYDDFHLESIVTPVPAPAIRSVSHDRPSAPLEVI
jgi:hypothetical protein